MVLFLFVLTIVVTPLSRTLQPKKAVAFDGGAGWVLNTKEFVLDPITWGLMSTAIAQVTANIVSWINSGFDGHPAFVNDLKGTLLNIANEQAGNLIYGTELGFMCSPFQLKVQAALTLNFANAQTFDVQCTLSDVVDNVDGFLNGDFSAGGWDGWYQMTQVPQNNPYGALSLAQTEMSARIENAQGQQLKLLDFGHGFFSYQHCEDVQVDPSGTKERHCTVTTPGAVVSDRLNQALGLGEKRLVTADEIDEMLGALLGYVGQEVLDPKNGYGLSGLGDYNNSGPNSYVNQLKQYDYRSTSTMLGHFDHKDPKHPTSTDAVQVNFDTSCNSDITHCQTTGGTESIPLNDQNLLPNGKPDSSSQPSRPDTSGIDFQPTQSGPLGEPQPNPNPFPNSPIQPTQSGPLGEPQPNPDPLGISPISPPSLGGGLF
jgi:hypothetical protein